MAALGEKLYKRLLPRLERSMAGAGLVTPGVAPSAAKRRRTTKCSPSSSATPSARNPPVRSSP